MVGHLSFDRFEHNCDLCFFVGKTEGAECTSSWTPFIDTCATLIVARDAPIVGSAYRILAYWISAYRCTIACIGIGQIIADTTDYSCACMRKHC